MAKFIINEQFLIILLNIIIILIALCYFLKFKGVNLCYMQLKKEHQILLGGLRKAENRILELNAELSQLNEHINILKEHYLIESNFIKDFIKFEYTKLNDVLNTSIILKKYISEIADNNLSSVLKKILDFTDIIKSNAQKQIFLNKEYSNKELDLCEVLATVNAFYRKTTYEKNIKLNINGGKPIGGIHIERTFLEYILLSIIGDMLKGVGKGNEINVSLEKIIKFQEEILEITFSDDGFGVNIDNIFGINYTSMEGSKLISSFLSNIEICNRELSNIGGKIRRVGNLDKVNRGSKYILSLPANIRSNKYTEYKKKGNVFYLYDYKVEGRAEGF